jgi:hypothetical protein
MKKKSLARIWIARTVWWKLKAQASLSQKSLQDFVGEILEDKVNEVEPNDPAAE